MKRSYEIDMCNGPLFGKILRFAVPLILSGILQLLFNAADIIVVGRFTGSDALAAVGSTSSLINLLVNLFIGVSVGANVMAARYYGSGSVEEMFQTVHTAILTALIGGCFMTVAGLLAAEPVLRLMGTPEEVLPQSVLYMRLYFIGMPALMSYNFGAAVLRAIGDTKRPLYFLSAAGVINVLFNLFFVVILHMGVEGVAIATVVSQVISSVLVLRCLCKSEGMYRLDLRRLHIHKDKLVSMLKIGLPAGFQGMMFNISNVLIQSSVNSFGALVMAGNTAAGNIEGFVYISMNAIYQTALSFTSQNVGARQYKRVGRILALCILITAVLGTVLGIGVYSLGNVFLRIYSADTRVIAYGMTRLAIICVPYALCGIMDVLAGSLRGMGSSVMPMITSLTGACLFRVVWIFTIFRWERSREILYISYPISWTLVLAMNVACYFWIRKKRFGPFSENTKSRA